MEKDGSSAVRRMRKRLDRDHDCQLYEKDFNLAIRLPLKSVEDVEEEDLVKARESLEELGTSNIEEKAVSAYIIADEDHLELEIELFLEAVDEVEVAPILDQIVREESHKRSSIDSRVRKIVENLSVGQRTKDVSGTGSDSAKMKASYTLGGRGRVVGSRPARKDVDFGDVAVVPSIRKAVREGSFDRIRGLNLKKEHLQEKVYRSRTQTNLCLVVDTSFYPDMKEEINTMLWIIRVLLTMAYEKRYHVGIVSFSDNDAELELPFTTDVDKGYEVVEKFDFGGLSPLTSGLKTGLEMLEMQRGDRTQTVSLMVVLTRGKANVPLYPGGFVRRELDYLSGLLKELPIGVLMVHIGDEEEETMKEFSLESEARYYSPPMLEKEPF